jgi:hypothetical protein
MQTALRALGAELEYLDRLLDSWNYQPINTPFDLLEKTRVDGNVIKIGGIRIKPAVALIVILLGFVLYGVCVALTR